VYEISRRDATVASRREISYTRLLIRKPLNKETPPGGGVSCDPSQTASIGHPHFPPHKTNQMALDRSLSSPHNESNGFHLAFPLSSLQNESNGSRSPTFLPTHFPPHITSQMASIWHPHFPPHQTNQMALDHSLSSPQNKSKWLSITQLSLHITSQMASIGHPHFPPHKTSPMALDYPTFSAQNKSNGIHLALDHSLSSPLTFLPTKQVKRHPFGILTFLRTYTHTTNGCHLTQVLPPSHLGEGGEMNLIENVGDGERERR